VFLSAAVISEIETQGRRRTMKRAKKAMKGGRRQYLPPKAVFSLISS